MITCGRCDPVHPLSVRRLLRFVTVHRDDQLAAGEERWIGHLGNLRNVVRQEVIARRIAPLAGGAPSLTLAVVGTQALRLASSGCRVTGVDPSAELLDLCAATSNREQLDVELLRGGSRIWTNCAGAGPSSSSVVMG